jgi:arabinogalactan endo-1,4-beta-galactosidase
MAYEVFSKVAFLPEDVVLRICEFTGPRSRWAFANKNILLDNLNKMHYPYWSSSVSDIISHLNQIYTTTIVQRSIVLKIQLSFDLLNEGALIQTDSSCGDYDIMQQSATQLFKYFSLS